jgi:hypothetical protein
MTIYVFWIVAPCGLVNVSDVSKYHYVFLFRGKQSKKSLLSTRQPKKSEAL